MKETKMLITYDGVNYVTNLDGLCVVVFTDLLNDFIVDSKEVLFINEEIFLLTGAKVAKLGNKPEKAFQTTRIQYCIYPEVYIKKDNEYEPISIEKVRNINKIVGLGINDLGIKEEFHPKDLIQARYSQLSHASLLRKIATPAEIYKYTQE